MTQNLGTIDRVIRIAAAIGIAVLYAVGLISGTTAIVLGFFAVVFLAASFLGFCPLYVPFKISTRKKG